MSVTQPLTCPCAPSRRSPETVSVPSTISIAVGGRPSVVNVIWPFSSGFPLYVTVPETFAYAGASLLLQPTETIAMAMASAENLARWYMLIREWS